MTWILFNEPKVFSHLEKHGSVCTVRDYKRKRGFVSSVKVGNRFPGMKVSMETIGKLDGDSLLIAHLEESGFENLDEWKASVIRQKHEDKPNLWLLRATIKG